MFRSFRGRVVKTMPRIVIKLENGKEFSPKPHPTLGWLKFGDEVMVTYDHNANRFRHIMPKERGTGVTYTSHHYYP